MVAIPLAIQGKNGVVQYRNIDALVAFLIERKAATLQELKTIYTLEDAMNMQEALEVPLINQWHEMEREKFRSKYRL